MRLLQDATNLLGPLDHKTILTIREFMDFPSDGGWNNIHSLIVSRNGCGIHKPGCKTIWQAVARLDPTFPRIGPGPGEHWSRIPDAVLVARAIKHATPIWRRGR